jgi:hypothetical protein
MRSSWQSRIGFASTALLLAVFAARSLSSAAVGILGPMPDAWDYAYGAKALLHGSYTVEWDGTSRLSNYTPGTSFLMAPLVALGGVDAATYLGALSGVLAGLVVATIVWRVARPAAAPLAVALVLATPATLRMAPLAMSDLPTAALLLLEAALLMRGRTAAIVAAGVISGYLVCMRPVSLLLLAAGLAALSAFPAWRRLGTAYIAGAVPLLVGLGLWQWVTLGSPLLTGYQSRGASPDGSGSLGSLFSPLYLFGPPPMADGVWANGPFADLQLPNAIAYALGLAGLEGFLVLPGVGLLGLLGLIGLARRRGTDGAVGRFGLAATALLFAMYGVYFYQSLRFVLPIAPFLAVGATWAAVQIAHWLAAWRSREVRPGRALARRGEGGFPLLAPERSPAAFRVQIPNGRAGLRRVMSAQGVCRSANCTVHS